MKIYLMLSLAVCLNANAQEGFICEPTRAIALKIVNQNNTNNALEWRTDGRDKRIIKRTLTGWGLSFFPDSNYGKSYVHACNEGTKESKVIHCRITDGGEFKFSLLTSRYIETSLGSYATSLEAGASPPQ